MAETVFNEGSIDGTDFRIESDGNTHMLFVDGGNDKVGINESAPAELLEISASSSPAIQLTQTGGTEYNSIIRLAGNDLEIRGSGGIMEFYNGSNDGDSSSLKLSITADGRIQQQNTSIANSCFDIRNSNAGGYGTSIMAGSGDNYSLLVEDKDGGAIVSFTENKSTFANPLYVPEYIYHDGDTNTNLRFLSDRIILNAGGNNMIDCDGGTITVNHDQQDIDFVIESNDNAYAFFVNAGGNAVGIGTSQNVGKLSVNSAINSSSISNAITIHQNTDGANKPAAGFGVAIGNGGESTNAADLLISTAVGGSLREQMKVLSTGVLTMTESSSGGIANQMKFIATTNYANGGYIDFTLAGVGAIVLICNFTNSTSCLMHMCSDNDTITMLANPAGSDGDGFNNIAANDTIRVYKSAGSYSFRVKNDTGATRAIGVAIINCHNS